jgi:hypothetical protein
VSFTNLFVDCARGDDQGPGTRASPLRTIAAARDRAQPGDMIYLRGGEHPVTATLTWRPERTACGTEQHPITLRSYPGERAVLAGDGAIKRLIQVRAGMRGWRFEDFELRNAKERCLELQEVTDFEIVGVVAHGARVPFAVYSSEGVTFRACRAYDFSSAGFAVKTGSVRVQFVDCIAHDSAPRGNRDGWEVANSTRGTTLRRCLAYNCADAGFDLASDTVVEDCVAYNCANGFKLWDSRKVDPAGKHQLRRCRAYDCRECGVLLAVRASASHGGGGGDNHADILNCTIVNCKHDIWIGTSSDEGYSSTATIRNTIASHAADQGRGGAVRALFVENANDCRVLEETNNCWHRADGPLVISYRGADFTAAQINNGTWIARTGLGQASFSAEPLFVSVAERDFRLLPTSCGVDAGVDIGLPFEGRAPDLGYAEVTAPAKAGR